MEEANITGFSYSEHLSFWLNTYNFLVVKIVRDNPCAYDIFGDCRPLRSLVEVGRQQPSSVTRAIWHAKALSIKSVNNVRENPFFNNLLGTSIVIR